MSKIVIIGAGFVGSTIAYALMLGGTAEEIVLIDKLKEKARGESMDLNHGASFVKPVNVYAGDYEDCSKADIVVITAGAPQSPGQSRIDLLQTNTAVMKQVVTSVMEYNREAILLVVTNPVDIMSYVSWKVSGLPHRRVIGSGTVLDTSRFRHLLSTRCRVDPRNIHAYVVGEHGDSEVLLWSSASIAGVSMNKFCQRCEHPCSEDNRNEISAKVRRAAYQIIDDKGGTYYAIALAVKRIIESILRDERSLLTVSALAELIPGAEDLYLSIPCILGRNGIEQVVLFQMNAAEEREFDSSIEVIKSALLQV